MPRAETDLRLMSLFGLLDALLFLRFWRVLVVPFWTHEPWFALMSLMHIVLVFSFAVSAWGFFRGSQWALTLYYVQFPLRLAYLTLTFGFLTYLSRIAGGPGLYSVLLLIVVVLEIGRLVLTIRYHRA